MGDSEEKVLILKVLNGPNTGSQMPVESGEELLVGSEDLCDVVLRDPHIEERHFTLRRSKNGELTVEPHDGAVYLEGNRLPNDVVLVRNFQILTVGSTHLVCGPADEAWPSLTWPEIREVGLKNEEASSSGTDSSEEEGEGEDPILLPEIPPKGGNQLMRGVLIAALILIAGVAILVWGTSGTSSATASRPSNHLPMDEGDIFRPYARTSLSQDEEAIYERVSRSIRSIAPRATVDAADLRGNLLLTVYVDGIREMNAVQKLLNQDKSFIVSGVIDRTSVAESLRTLVEQLGYDLNVEVTGNGIAHWTGFLPSVEAWNEIQSKVASDIPRQKKNVPDFTYGGSFEEEITRILSEAGLLNYVKPEFTKKGIFFVGQISPSLLGAWSQAYTNLQASLGQVALRNDVSVGESNETIVSRLPSVTPPPQEVHYFSSPVVFVMSGKDPWVRLANGDVLFPGAMLKNGYVFEGVDQEVVVLNDGKKKVLVPLEKLD